MASEEPVIDYGLNEDRKCSDLYRRGYRSGPVKRTLSWAVPLLDHYRTVMDFGCGLATSGDYLDFQHYVGVDIDRGQIDRLLRENTDDRCTFARGDIADQLELDACDLGLCIGVLQHIPTDRIDAALDTIASLSTQQVISVCPHSSGHGLHLTVKPADWWEQRLQDHLQIVHAGDNRFVCRS